MSAPPSARVFSSFSQERSRNRGRPSSQPFVIAGIAVGPAALCYAELASTILVSGSTYSSVYAAPDELVVFGFQLPQALSTAPFDRDPIALDLPAVILIAMCAILLIRGASESAGVNA